MPISILESPVPSSFEIFYNSETFPDGWKTAQKLNIAGYDNVLEPSASIFKIKRSIFISLHASTMSDNVSNVFSVPVNCTQVIQFKWNTGYIFVDFYKNYNLYKGEHRYVSKTRYWHNNTKHKC